MQNLHLKKLLYISIFDSDNVLRRNFILFLLVLPICLIAFDEHFQKTIEKLWFLFYKQQFNLI